MTYKVFGIGFQKTGTSSLGKALETLGFRVGGYWDFRDLAQASDLTREQLLERASLLTPRYDAFKDTPWPVFYRELDASHPGSKFIHIVRDTDRWIESAVKDFGSYPNAIHRVIYGCDYPVGNEDIWIKRYEKHNREVKEYFKDRPDDFISLHMNHGELSYEPLCNLLNRPVLDAPWPHTNKIGSKKRRMFIARVVNKLWGSRV